jgi:Protein of unknown function (DUF2786)
MNTPQDTLRKVAKLLRLATSSNPHEAATAAAHAQAIMDREGIERAAVSLENAEALEAIEDFGTKPGGQLDTIGLRSRWQGTLAIKVSKANGCHVYRRVAAGGNRELCLIGRPSKVEACRYLYGWLSREIARLIDREGRGMGPSWRQEYGIGAALEVGRRLAEQHQETLAQMLRESEHNPHALIRVQSAIAIVEAEAAETHAWGRKHLGLCPTRSSAIKNGTARDAGRAAGARINLNPAAGAIGRSPRLIGGRA